MTDETNTTPINEQKDEKGRFLPGNRFWERRSSFGRDPKFENPEDLKKACYEYFEDVQNNPLGSEKIGFYEGSTNRAEYSLMRAMTISGLCIFLGIGRSTWTGWRLEENSVFSTVIEEVEEIIRTQKFEGAAAGLLKENIIARDLGLADTRGLQHLDGKGDKTDPPSTSLKTDPAYQAVLEHLQAEEDAEKGDNA